MKYSILALLATSIFFNIWFIVQGKPRANTIPQHSFSFLSQTVDYIPKENRLINFLPLRLDLAQYIGTQSGTVGMYFEYIPTGISIGINEKVPFVYSNLLKVPLVMAVYAKKNTGKLPLSQILTITEDHMDPTQGDLWAQGAGKTISIKDTVEHTLIRSDNTGYNLLRSTITLQDFGNVFNFLDIPVEEVNQQPAVTPKNYSSILRSLYYSSFLPPEDSQDILHFLSQSTYTQGIRQAIPSSVLVAHKMSVHKSEEIFSDCGIIYLPNRPYFLCIMIQKESEQHAHRILQDISQKIFAFVSTTQ